LAIPSAPDQGPDVWPFSHVSVVLRASTKGNQQKLPIVADEPAIRRIGCFEMATSNG